MTTEFVSSSDVTQTFHIINFSGDDEKWTVNAGVTLHATGDAAVLSSHSLAQLINNGTLIGDSTAYYGSGVDVTGPGGTPGDIIITNNGEIRGTAKYGIYVEYSTDGFTLNNHGTVFGKLEGIFLLSDNIGGTITNDGTIESDDSTAIYVSTDFGLTTSIDNKAGGLIRGSSSGGAILTIFGSLDVTNRGTIDGKIVCTAFDENDQIVNYHKIKGAVLLGRGDDEFKNAGDGSSGLIFGDAGADIIKGGSGNDRIDGGGVFGGARTYDLLTGGGGKDKFIFDFDVNPFINIEKITDFRPGSDKILLDDDFYHDVGPHGALKQAAFHVGGNSADKSDRVLYDPGNGHLLYDFDGKGDNGPLLVALLSKHLSIHASDFTVIG